MPTKEQRWQVQLLSLARFSVSSSWPLLTVRLTFRIQIGKRPGKEVAIPSIADRILRGPLRVLLPGRHALYNPLFLSVGKI